MPNNIIKVPIIGTGQPEVPSQPISSRILRPLEKILWHELSLSMARKFLIMLDNAVGPDEFEFQLFDIQDCEIYLRAKNSITKIITSLPQCEQLRSRGSSYRYRIGAAREPHFTICLHIINP